MNTNTVCTLILAAVFGALSSLAHGGSDQMSRELNAKAPEWLSIGVPIKVEPSGGTIQDEAVFHPRSGGATNSRNQVRIPARGIEIRVDYEIDWTGNNEAGTGCSLSPDGTRLIVNSGPTSHIYEISPNGESREIPLQLPHVTYDAGRKGYLRGWSWADGQTLVAKSEITDETGDEIIENRIYVFHMNERTLSRLDLNTLNLPTLDGLEITKIGKDLHQLTIMVGNKEYTVKADLKSSPKIAKRETGASKTTAPLANPEQSRTTAPKLKTSETGEKSASSTPWLSLIAMIIVAFGLLWLLLKSRK